MQAVTTKEAENPGVGPSTAERLELLKKLERMSSRFYAIVMMILLAVAAGATAVSLFLNIPIPKGLTIPAAVVAFLGALITALVWETSNQSFAYQRYSLSCREKKRGWPQNVRQ